MKVSTRVRWREAPAHPYGDVETGFPRARLPPPPTSKKPRRHKPTGPRCVERRGKGNSRRPFNERHCRRFHDGLPGRGPMITWALDHRPRERSPRSPSAGPPPLLSSKEPRRLTPAGPRLRGMDGAIAPSDAIMNDKDVNHKSLESFSHDRTPYCGSITRWSEI